MFQVFTIDSLASCKKPKWIVDGIIPDSSSIIMYGAPGCGKTFTALDIGLHIAHKRAWQGHRIKKHGIVVYMVAEGLYGISTRCNAWHDYHNVDITPLFLIIPFHTVTLWKDEVIEQLKITLNAVTNEVNVSLIIVDTLSRAMCELEENSSKDAMIFMHQMELLKEAFDCSILFVHHAGKDVQRGMRGSSALLASVDTCIMIDKQTNRVSLVTQKQKDGDPVHLSYNLVKHNDSLIVSTNNEKIATHRVSNEIDDNRGKQWSSEQEEWMLKAIRKGLSYSEIGDRMKRTSGAIRSRVRHIIIKNDWNVTESMEKTGLTKEQVESLLK